MQRVIEARLTSLQTWVVAGLSFMFMCAVTFLCVSIFVVYHTHNRVREAKEKSDQGLACYVLPQLERAEQTLPSLDYYRQHPDELVEQLGVVRQQRKLALDTWGGCDSLPSSD